MDGPFSEDDYLRNLLDKSVKMATHTDKLELQSFISFVYMH